MFGKLLLLFILVPLADLILLLLISKSTSWLTTIIIVVVSGAIGAYLATRQSRAVKSQIRDRLNKNQMPADLLTDGMMIFVAAILLVTPGLITDCFGLSLLIPAARRWYKGKAKTWLRDHFQVNVIQPGKAPFDPDVVDGDLVEPDDGADESRDQVIDVEPQKIAKS